MEPQANLIHTAESYQQSIINVLNESIPTATSPEGLNIVPVFDRQSNRYQLLCQGWTSDGKRVFYPIVHIEVIGDRVWIQHNQSDIDFGELFSKRGIPKSQIVLGLHPMSVRQLNQDYSVE